MLPDIITALVDTYRPSGIVLRNDSGQRTLEGLPLEKRVALGQYPGPIQIDLNGLKFSVDIMEGQNLVVFKYDLAGYLPVYDLTKNAIVHGIFL